MGECQIAVFNLNNQKCGAETSQVKSIVKYQELTKKPEMHKFIDGFIFLGDREVPVVCLNRRFGLGETKITLEAKILITEINNCLIGFAVNNVDKIINVSDDELEETPDIIRRSGNKFVKKIGKKGEKLLPILDLSRILIEDELKSLTE